MTQEEIEGNKLIAEFMEADMPSYSKDANGFISRCSLVYNNFRANYIYVNGKWYEHEHQFKFHSSWDWLIPVVNKFINETVPPTESKDINEYRGYCNRLHNLVTDYNIIPVFNCLAKAIKWYNRTKQSKK